MTFRSRRGFSLVELMIAIVVMGIVLAGTMNFFMGQSRTFRKATTDMVLLQNARFATDLLSQHMRSVGANLTVGQPAVIYVDQNTFAFNADYATNLSGDHDAVYYEPNAPLTETQTLLQAAAAPLLNTTLTYPAADYTNPMGAPSPAETITFSFAPDTETSRTDDFVLLRQVNGSVPEVVVRNVLPDSTYPFFRYMYLRTDASGNELVDTIKTSDLPLRYDLDSTVYNDMIRGVIVSFQVTNGLLDTAQRVRPVSVIASLPNVGMRDLQTCGGQPLPVPTPSVASPSTGVLVVTWDPSPDETGGERDVTRYAITRSTATDPTVWQTIGSVSAGGSPPYSYTDTGLNPNETYYYAVAAQDCTPAFSTATSTAGVSP
jgi:prepilin-type N-terminal cleavage/methylation domain-containing protein